MLKDKKNLETFSSVKQQNSLPDDLFLEENLELEDQIKSDTNPKSEVSFTFEKKISMINNKYEQNSDSSDESEYIIEKFERGYYSDSYLVKLREKEILYEKYYFFVKYLSIL